AVGEPQTGAQLDLRRQAVRGHLRHGRGELRYHLHLLVDVVELFADGVEHDPAGQGVEQRRIEVARLAVEGEAQRAAGLDRTVRATGPGLRLGVVDPGTAGQHQRQPGGRRGKSPGTAGNTGTDHGTL